MSGIGRAIVEGFRAAANIRDGRPVGSILYQHGGNGVSVEIDGVDLVAIPAVVTAAMDDQAVSLGIKQSAAPVSHDRRATLLPLNIGVCRADGADRSIRNLIPAEIRRYFSSCRQDARRLLRNVPRKIVSGHRIAVRG